MCRMSVCVCMCVYAACVSSMYMPCVSLFKRVWSRVVVLLVFAFVVVDSGVFWLCTCVDGVCVGSRPQALDWLCAHHA
jgi:hypothetical protein